MSRLKRNGLSESCVSCGYNISSLPDAERCPECGFDVGWGRAHPLDPATPGLLARLSYDFRLLAWGLALAIATFPIAVILLLFETQSSAGLDEREIRAAVFFVLLGSALWNVGLLRFAPLDVDAPGYKAGRFGPVARDVMVLMLLTIAVVVCFPFRVAWPLCMLLIPILVICEYRAWLCMRRFLATLARRIPDRRLYVHFYERAQAISRWILIVMVVAYVALGITSLIKSMVSGDPLLGDSMSVYMAVLALGSLWISKARDLLPVWGLLRRLRKREASA